ncbi:MAG: hypothetical protein WCA00_09645 [Candidatus Acidiferrales bacterium]
MPTHVEQNRPPLANQLFQDRGPFAAALAEFPDCHAVVPWLRDPKGTTLESQLQRLQDEAETYPARHSQLAAVRYYLQQMLYRCEQGWNQTAMGVTNYKTLLDMVEQWRQSRDESVFLVTFNYDTLLEHSLPDVGLKIETISDYVSGHPGYVVVKLHGSVNWSREIDSPTDFPQTNDQAGIRRELIRRAAELVVSTRYVQQSPYSIALHEGKVVFPAIAIPVERKSQFECPSDHFDALRSRLPNVRKILVIGWRAMEEHFLKILSEHLRAPLEVLVVDGSNENAADVEGRLEKVIGSLVPGRIQSVSGGFTEFVVGRRAVSFLESQSPAGGAHFPR